MNHKPADLEIRNIHKSYDGQPLLNGLSMTVSAGEIVCLLGSSGSGKSTLLRLVAGLETPESGQICWQGQDMMNIPVHRRGFGLMFQDYALFPHRTVAQNVAFGLRMQSLPKRVVEKRVAETLQMVNMPGFENRLVTSLSGGEQQRIALARSLAPRPHLLMLDEPLGALDRSLKEQLAAELRQVLKAANIPVIYVTHDQEEAYTIARRLTILHAGKILQDGTSWDIYNHPANSWVARFLGLNNLVPGEMITLNPVMVRTDLGIIQVSAPLGWSIHPGEKVILLIRPTAARLNGAPINSIKVKVIDIIFRGDNHRVIIETPTGVIMQFHLMDNPGLMTELEISLSPDDIQILKD